VTNTSSAKVVSICERRRSSLGPQARRVQRPSLLVPVLDPLVSSTFNSALVLSIAFHLALAFGISFVLPNLRILQTPSTSLEVVLVNSKSASQPLNPKLLAQANLDGGGNTDEALHAKTPLPMTVDETEGADDANVARSKVTELEQHTQELMTKLKSAKQLERQAPLNDPSEKQDNSLPVDLREQRMQMARLEAQIARNMEIYEQRPKRQFVGARAKEFRFATYVDQWKQKIERVGTLNFPEEAKIRKLYGRLQLTVAIKSDGTVERIDVNRSSGYQVLDDAAKRIVFLASPYAKFPEEIRKDTDVLEITRTWTFTREDQVSAE